MTTMLDDTTVVSKRKVTVNGTKVEYELTKGDFAAEWTERWREDEYTYPLNKPSVEKRKAEREKIKQWLTEQLALARAGKKTAIHLMYFTTTRWGGLDVP